MIYAGKATVDATIEVSRMHPKFPATSLSVYVNCTVQGHSRQL